MDDEQGEWQESLVSESLSSGRRKASRLLIAAVITALLIGLLLGNLLTVHLGVTARLRANEKSAIFYLRTVSSAQETYRASIMKDLDNDGVGEYGTFDELLGWKAAPGASGPASPPFLDNGLMGEGGPYWKSGYDSTLVVGPAAGGLDCYYFAMATPVIYKRSGIRSFCVDATGVVRGRDNGGEPGPISAMIGGEPWPEVEG